MQIITHSKHAVNLAATERTISVFGGAALAVWGIRRKSAVGIAMAAVGGDLVRRGITGRSYLYEALGVRTAPLGQGADTTSVPYELGLRVERAVTVDKPRAEVYRFWRELSNLPRFMEHLVAVTDVDGKRSHWTAKAPAGRTVEWDAEIITERENELIGWRSLSGADVENAGSVRFTDAPGGRGTVVRVEFQYNPPAGVLGALAAQMWGEEPTQQVAEDLRRFKEIMEAGEVPTTEGQPSGRGPWRAEVRRQSEQVRVASEESFPASDAPAWR